MNRSHALILFWLVLLATAACGQYTTPATAPTSVEGQTATATPTVGATEALPPDLNLSPSPPPATILPTATYNPALAAWTILVYMNGDNNLEEAALSVINRMEAAGGSERVNIVVQLDRATGYSNADGDWASARRYRIAADQDLQTITSPILQDLGEVNMGDPATLADFVAWGIRTYRANHYGLVLWDHGIGWSGIAFDDSSADRMTLHELDAALGAALAAAELPQLDIIGFDASLMGQLEVYAAAAPHARFAVASEELVPGHGWDYTALLSWLYANPAAGSTQVAESAVITYLNYYTAEQRNAFVAISAVDLARIPGVVGALERLTAALQQDLSFATGAVGDARSGAESYAKVYGPEAELYAAVDLHHFATILSERTLDPTMAEASTAVAQAVDGAILRTAHGRGFTQSHGISIYFPRTAAFYNNAYASEGSLLLWNNFLLGYYTTSSNSLVSPHLEIANAQPGVVSVQQPAHLGLRLTGRDVAEVALWGGRYLEDGRRLLLKYDPLVPEPDRLANGELLYTWNDGLHEDFHVWNTRVPYLTDGVNGDFVVLWPTYTDTLRTVEGRYTPIATNIPFEANLIFDRDTRAITAVWGFTQDGSPFEIPPQLDDVFQPYRFYLNDDNSIGREPGFPLRFRETAGNLSYSWELLPSGRYFLGFEATNIAGERSATLVDLDVQNPETAPAVAYLDPYVGYQFLYPADWHQPAYGPTSLVTSSPDGATQLQVILYPNLSNGTADQLRQQTLKQFGAVAVLYQDDVAIERDGSPIGGLLTAYGYTAADGPHTGIFVTFVHNNIGYVVDVDGPETTEAETIALMQQIVSSWTFRGVGLFPTQWGKLAAVGFDVPQPADFQYEDAAGGWQRFSANRDSHIFVALRAEAVTAVSQAETVSYWSNIGAQGVAGYQAGEPYRFALAQEPWLRLDFSYTAEDGREIRGFILTADREGQRIIAWVEAPAAEFDELENSIFQVMLSGIDLEGGR